MLVIVTNNNNLSIILDHLKVWGQSLNLIFRLKPPLPPIGILYFHLWSEKGRTRVDKL